MGSSSGDPRLCVDAYAYWLHRVWFSQGVVRLDGGFFWPIVNVARQKLGEGYTERFLGDCFPEYC